MCAAEFVTDIAAIYPSKNVTLLHSRRRLLPRFDPAMHTEGNVPLFLIFISVATLF